MFINLILFSSVALASPQAGGEVQYTGGATNESGASAEAVVSTRGLGPIPCFEPELTWEEDVHPWTRPMDAELAVGPYSTVAVSNWGAMILDNQTGNPVGTQIPLSQWVGPGSGNVSDPFDPVIHYSQETGKFYAAMLEVLNGAYHQQYLVLAISTDSNPQSMSGWTIHRLELESVMNDLLSTRWSLDFPNLAIIGDNLIFSADWFQNAGGNFVGRSHSVGVIPLASLAPGGNPANEMVWAETAVAAKAMGIAQPFSAPNSDDIVLVAAVSGSRSRLLLTSPRWDPAGNLSWKQTFVNIPEFEFPNDGDFMVEAMNMSKPLDINDERIKSSVLHDGKLYATHHVGEMDNGNGLVVSRWYEIDLNGWPSTGQPSLVSSGTIKDAHGAAAHYIFPSVAVDIDGNMGISYNRCSITENLSIGYAVRREGQTDWDDQVVVETGDTSWEPNGPISGDPNPRWADYSSSDSYHGNPGVFRSHYGVPMEQEVGNSSIYATTFRTYLVEFDIHDLEIQGPTVGQSGHTVSIQINGAQPNSTVKLAYGYDGLGHNSGISGLDGMSLNVMNIDTTLATTSDANGDATFLVSIPSTPPAYDMVLQAYFDALSPNRAGKSAVHKMVIQ